MAKLRRAVYPGTFDPITNGHLDVIERAAQIFDEVIVLIARNPTKRPLFTEQERLTMARAATQRLPNVTVDSFDGLLVDYVRQRQACAIIRGLRAVSDFEYEFQMALMNRKLAPAVTTVFLMPNERYTYLNSTIIRELARYGADVQDFVPPIVVEYLRTKFATLDAQAQRREDQVEHSKDQHREES